MDSGARAQGPPTSNRRRHRQSPARGRVQGTGVPEAARVRDCHSDVDLQRKPAAASQSATIYRPGGKSEEPAAELRTLQGHIPQVMFHPGWLMRVTPCGAHPGQTGIYHSIVWATGVTQACATSRPRRGTTSQAKATQVDQSRGQAARAMIVPGQPALP